MSSASSEQRPLRLSDIVQTWWPLAASWLLMAAELPAASAVMNRLPDGHTNLAAWGDIVFPLAVFVEAPIIMLLAASTALSKDRASYRRLLSYTNFSGAALTVIHVLLSFTVMYDWVVVGLMNAPAEIVEPGRLGLQVMTPWTWAIADRRFHQGVLIRFGRSRAVVLGTMVRLCTTGTALLVGAKTEWFSGIVVGAGAVTCGVMAEMVAVRLCARPLLKSDALDRAPAPVTPVCLRNFLVFYVPLALTPILNLMMAPIASSAINRMPEPVSSAAIWGVVYAAMFAFRSTGFAFNEVSVRHAGDPESDRTLARFARLLAVGLTLALILCASGPVAPAFFEHVISLDPLHSSRATTALLLGLLLPTCSVIQSLFQGILTHAHRTRAITESVAVSLVVVTAVLWGAVQLQRWDGLMVTMVAMSAGHVAQTAWLWFRHEQYRRARAA